MKKNLKIILGIIVLVVIIVALAGMYKFNYLANQPGYDVDGNKITETIEVETIEQVETEEESIVSETYCSDLKSRVSGSQNYVIMTEIASGVELISGQDIAGCVYAPNGSYAGWAPFEGQVGTYELLASDGTVLTTGYLPVVETNWMERATDAMSLQYRREIMFDPGTYTSGQLLLKNENASGEPERDKTITIPVTF